MTDEQEKELKGFLNGDFADFGAGVICGEFDEYVFCIQVEFQINNVRNLAIHWLELHNYVKDWLNGNK